MASQTSLGNLTPEEQEQLRDVRARFERAWKKDPPPDLNRFLPPGDHRIRLPLLCELIEADMEFRWRRAEPTFVEFYLERFPEISKTRAALVQIISIEYRIRREHGDDCGLAAYRDRFPKEYTDLQNSVATPSSTDMEGTHSHRTHVVSRPGSIAGPTPPVGMPMAAPGVTIPVGGGFKLIEKIGSGGFGEVWKAYAPGDVECAMKIIFRPLDHADAQSELDALELVKKLNHPFLLHTQSYFALDDRLLIVMELAEGSLRTRLRELVGAGVPGIPASELVRHFGEACEAIDFLHARHVLHRDIKPDNILLVAGHVKVCDFGLARALPSMQSLRVTGMSGTPGYMAPEVWKGHPGPRSDQYALAASYVEMRLNRSLFPGKDYYETMVNHVEREPDLNAIPAPEREILLRALAKQPNRRFQNCMEFWEAPLQSTRAPSRPSQTPLQPPVGGEGTDVIDFGDGSGPPEGPTEFDEGASGTRRLRPSSPQYAAVTEPPVRTTEAYKPEPWIPRWAVRLSAFGAVVAAIVVAIILAGGNNTGSPTVPEKNGNGGNGKHVVHQLKLPEGFKPADGANITLVNGREVYDRIERVTPGGIRVEFILIRQMTPTEERPFYMMKTKVWNKLYDEFAQHAEMQGKPVDPAWKKGSRVKIKESEKDPFKDLPAEQTPLYPVFRITLDEAQRFAVWLGGELPTARQWDQAAGRYVQPQVTGLGGLVPGLLQTPVGSQFSNPTPFRWPYVKYGYALYEAMNAGVAILDVSPSGCRDVAGNGYEWTRSLYKNEDQVINFDDKNNVEVSIRSQAYNAGSKEEADPFNFDKLRDLRWRIKDENKEGPSGASVDVSFRVAIDLEMFLSQVE